MTHLIDPATERVFKRVLAPLAFVILAAGLYHNAYLTNIGTGASLQPISAFCYSVILLAAMTRRRDRTAYAVATVLLSLALGLSAWRITEALFPGMTDAVETVLPALRLDGVTGQGRFAIETASVAAALSLTLLSERVSLRAAGLLTVVSMSAGSYVIAHFAVHLLFWNLDASIFSILALMACNAALFIRYRATAPVKALHCRRTRAMLWPLLLASQALPWGAAFKISQAYHLSPSQIPGIEAGFGLTSAALMALSFWVADMVGQNQAAMEKLAFSDPLTGALNRAGFHRDPRHRRPSSLLLLDLDHFKTINDTYGHDAGDEVLKRVVATAKDLFGPARTVTRWGGEEILVWAEAMPDRALARIGEQLRAAIEALDLSDLAGDDVPVPRITASIGYGRFDPAHETIREAVKTVDTALYVAKHSGRNQCVSAIGRINAPVLSVMDFVKCDACMADARAHGRPDQPCNRRCMALTPLDEGAPALQRHSA